MPTLDEILDAMPDEQAEAGREYLIIDPLGRTITVPESERVFAVTGDEYADRKYFRCPRIVGDGLDLAAMFLRVNYRNAGGDEDGYLVEDVAVSGDYVTFSWLLAPKVAEYMGTLKFGVCADLPDTNDRKMPDWNTFLASGEVLEGMHPYDGEVEQETSDVVTQLRAMVTAQTGAVEAVGAQQVQAVQKAANAAQEAAVAAVQAQGAASRASIPADYTTLAATVDRLTRDRAAAIVCEAQGTAIQVTDASADPLQGLRIFGRSTQDGTPTPDNPVEIKSLAAPVVRVCSRNLFDIATMLGQYATLTNGDIKAPPYRSAANIPVTPGRKYTVSAYVYGNEENANALALSVQDGKETGYTTMDGALGIVVGVKAEPTLATITFTAASDYISISANAFILDSIMVVAGETAADFEPYTGQALTITTPGSLPGIPVASGGNYTDENGQQWIADEVDLARGVYVQRVGKITFDGSQTYHINAFQQNYGYYVYGCTRVGASYSETPVLADKLNFKPWGRFTVDDIGNYICYEVSSFYISLADQSIQTVEAFREYLAENPITAQYVLANPMEKALTDAEIQAFRALHSVKPTTTVLTDTGAHMALEYAADPKTYIDNKLAALVAAAAN